jgi:cell division protein FtsZ
MTDLKFVSPKEGSNIIKVLGVGGGGSNAVSYMYKQGIKDVDFIICNTDAQALDLSPVPNKIQLGEGGLGAGAIPEVGRQSALENIEQVKEILELNTKMLFITAGMGGGTGTGGAPVIAQAARELDCDILIVGIVTMPFMFEGRKRQQQALAGIEELRKHVDSLLLINNDKLRELFGNLTLSQAFHQADEVLTTAAKGIAEIITFPGYVNVDFKDVRTVMKNSGKAIMGSATAEGENRAITAIEKALSSPLLDDNNIKGADNILLYMASGNEELSLDEVMEITDYIQNEAGQTAEILWGNGIDERLGKQISVTVVATGFENKRKHSDKEEGKIVKPLYEPENEEKSGINDTKQVLANDDQEMKLITRKPEVVKEPPEKPRVFTFDFDLQDTADNQSAKPQETGPEEIKPQQKEEFEEKAEPERIFFQVRNTAGDPKPAPAESDEPDHQKRAQERIEKLKELSLKLKTPGGLAEMEREPAYIRKKMELKDPPPNNGQHTSRFTLSGDDEKNTDIRSNNSYLHDNVD